MMRILCVAMAAATAFAGAAPSDGYASCKCLGTLSKEIKRIDCTHKWANEDGKCVMTDPKYGNTGFNEYPGDYGTSCTMWVEPGWTSCFDNSTNPPTRLTTPSASWCEDPWCYVDPCKCDSSDATTSSTFAHLNVDKMYYSYTTCGASDKFTDSKSENKVGNAECSGGSTGTDSSTDTGASQTTDGAASLKPWISLLAMVVFLGVLRM